MYEVKLINVGRSANPQREAATPPIARAAQTCKSDRLASLRRKREKALETCVKALLIWQVDSAPRKVKRRLVEAFE